MPKLRLQGTVDSGARWRIKAVKSGRYFYRNGQEVIGTKQFFSLFELRRTRDGAYLIADHAGKWLHVPATTQDGRTSTLEAIDYSEANLPGPDDAAPSASSLEGTPAPTPFWIKHHETGGYILQLSSDGKRYLSSDAADPRKLVPTATDGWFWQSSTAAVGSNALFELQRVVGASAGPHSPSPPHPMGQLISCPLSPHHQPLCALVTAASAPVLAQRRQRSARRRWPSAPLIADSLSMRR
eukprot:scaffold90119_cov21-Tisochrysis_lutea.AAC.2